MAQFVFLFAFPASSNYKLDNFEIGTGGVGNATSTNYASEAISGEVSQGKLDGTTYDLGSGLQFTNQANVPPAPTFTNPSNYYNKLRLILSTGGNPTDTKFAVAISTDNFVTTNYVQSDNTVGATLGSEDYRTYASFGSGTGVLVIGLTPGTTYKVKVKAMQGKFTETGYGPEATASTVNPQMTFDIDVSATDSNTDPPYATNLGALLPGTVTDSPEKIWIDFTTNGETGGRVYVYSTNAGLRSAVANFTISAVAGNLTALSEGFGAQGSSAGQTSGGPLSISAAYNLAGNNVGLTDTTIREIFESSNPITGGRGSFLLKAKASTTTPAALDYTETLTVIASASF